MTWTLWLIGGKGSAFDPRGLYNDPPVCGEAKDYAMQVYPYLAMPSYAKMKEASNETNNRLP